jgi:hypothetical protein
MLAVDMALRLKDALALSDAEYPVNRSIDWTHAAID